MTQRALPPILDSNSDQQKNTQIALGTSVSLPLTPIAPWNFRAKNQRGGILLTWSPLLSGQMVGTGSSSGSAPSPSNGTLPRADGYEIQRSDSGDFSAGKYISVPIRDPAQDNYFDSLGGGVLTKYYRIRATNGTVTNPYTVHGIFSGSVKHTSIDASDTTTVPTTVYDTFTTDATQSRARAWKSGTQYPNQR